MKFIVASLVASLVASSAFAGSITPPPSDPVLTQTFDDIGNNDGLDVDFDVTKSAVLTASNQPDMTKKMTIGSFTTSYGFICTSALQT
jgi:hypothetical protein